MEEDLEPEVLITPHRDLFVVNKKKRVRGAGWSEEGKKRLRAVVVGNPLPTVEQPLVHAEREAGMTAEQVGGRGCSDAEAKALKVSEAVTMQREDREISGREGEVDGGDTERTALESSVR
eukprot:438341-Rhodomonas_salina.1